MGTVTIPFTNPGNYWSSKCDFFDGTVANQEDNVYLLNHWRFNENLASTSTALDWCSSDATYNHGTVYGSISRNNNSKYDEGYYINDHENYLNRVEIDINTFPNNGDFSFFAWIKRSDDSSGAVNVIASQSGSSSTKSWAFYQYNDKLYFLSCNSGTNYFYSVNFPEDTFWHLVGFWLNINTPELKIYVDGNITAFTTIENPDNPSDYFTIGNHPNHFGDTTRRNFRGTIDNPKIYSGELSSTDITNMYNATDQFYKTSNSSAIHRVVNTTNFLTEAVGKYTSFNVVYGDKNNGTPKFSISTDGTNFYYWNGSAWTLSTNNSDSSQASTEADIDANISSFDTNDSDELYINTFLETDGNHLTQIDSISLDYGASTTHNNGLQFTINIPQTISKGLQFQALIADTVNKGIQFNMKPYDTNENRGVEFNIAPYAGQRYTAVQFNVAPFTEFTHKGVQFKVVESETIGNRGVQFRVEDYPETVNKGLQFNLDLYEETVNKGLQFNGLLPIIENRGLEFNITGHEETINKGIQFNMKPFNGQDNRGVQFNLYQPEVDYTAKRGIQFRAGVKDSAWVHKGLMFRVLARIAKAVGIQFTGSQTTTNNRGISFKVIGGKSTGIKFYVKVKWKYIDRLISDTVEWIKLK